MRLQTKILTAALFAGILSFSLDSPGIEMKLFSLSAPSQAALDYTLTLAAAKVPAAKEETQFLKIAQNTNP
ncbi:MAG: hypothetical protein EOP11_23305 [Proteobacteria bacterium]|nr:MAG: hypothetical protein EOP11_23305 [Pseudomonadota bacterium]